MDKKQTDLKDLSIELKSELKIIGIYQLKLETFIDLSSEINETNVDSITLMDDGKEKSDAMSELKIKLIHRLKILDEIELLRDLLDFSSLTESYFDSSLAEIIYAI